jgi:hypothetical protein
MNRIEAHTQDLYKLRFSPMCKPAGEVANLTQMESHTVRARMIMLWRIAEGHLPWGPREVELLYQSTLDSISEAFDVFHYPISRYMLDARADVWDAGLAPEPIKRAVEDSAQATPNPAPSLNPGESLLLASEIAQVNQERMEKNLQAALAASGVKAQTWLTPSGALAYALGAWEIARQQAQQVIAGLKTSQAGRVIADGPETAWALTKIYPALGLALPAGMIVELCSERLAESHPEVRQTLGKVCVHDGRPACLIAEGLPNHLAILPGYTADENAFGAGTVYEAPRRLLDELGAERVFGTWTRGLAKSCGVDDGLWLTYPDLAAGLARQRLEYAREIGADTIVTDSPLCAAYLKDQRQAHHPAVVWLPELLIQA